MFSACEKVSGSAQALGQLQRRLDPLHGDVVLAREEEEATELRRERARSASGSSCERASIRTVHALEAILRTASVPHDLREPCRDAGGSGCVAPLLSKELDRLLEVSCGIR